MSQFPLTPSFRLDGRRALVAGATSGIGLGSAAALAQAGAQVTLIARRGDVLDEVVENIRAAGFDAQALPLDITDLDAMTETLKAQQPFDVLVNSAGLARHGPALETQVQDYQAVMDVNVKAAYFLSVGVAQGNEENPAGEAVLLTSALKWPTWAELIVRCIVPVNLRWRA